MPVSVKYITSGFRQSPIKIIFLHGGPGLDHSYFLPGFSDFEKDFFCIYYTQGQHKNPGLPQLLSELEALRKSLVKKGERVVLLGHSFGGTLALEYIRKFGEKNLLALVAISWNYSTRLQFKFMRLGRGHNKSPHQQELPLDYDDAQYRQDALSALPFYFTKNWRDEGARIFKAMRFDAGQAQKIRLEFLNRYHGTDTLKRLTLPTLCLYGGRDKIITPAYIRHGLSLNPKIIGKKVSHAGHFPFVENADAVNSNIKKFLLGLGKKT